MPAKKSVEAPFKEHPPKIDLTEEGKFYKRPYRMNAVGRDGLTVTVGIPREIIKRAAEKRKVAPKEFMKAYHAILIYKSFDGAFIRFAEADTNKEP